MCSTRVPSFKYDYLYCDFCQGIQKNILIRGEIENDDLIFKKKILHFPQV